MNPLVLQFINGTGFFVGLAIVLVAFLLRFQFTGRFSRPILTIIAIVGAVFVAISGTPLSLWWYGLWALSFLCSLVALESKRFENFRKPAVASVLIISILLSALEMPYSLTPQIRVNKGQKVFVIGDSISAGMGTKETNWPVIMSKRHGLNVVNLAVPGATSEVASNQVTRITEDKSVVLVEIGGNDFFGSDDSGLFTTCLDQLLSGLREHGHSIVMFELPLPPFYNRYGRIQRTLAKKYGVALIPKRYMTHVLGIPDATRDGLHLSQKGHDAMADVVYGLMRVEGGAPTNATPTKTSGTNTSKETVYLGQVVTDPSGKAKFSIKVDVPEAKEKTEKQ